MDRHTHTPSAEGLSRKIGMQVGKGIVAGFMLIVGLVLIIECVYLRSVAAKVIDSHRNSMLSGDFRELTVRLGEGFRVIRSGTVIVDHELTAFSIRVLSEQMPEAQLVVEYHATPLITSTLLLVLLVAMPILFSVIRGRVVRRFQQELNDRLSKQRSEQLLKLATQVSHDIRSPLAVLQMLIPSIEGIGENDKQVLIAATKRIGTIANDLLDSKKQAKMHSDFPVSNLMVMLKDLKIEKSLGAKVPIHWPTEDLGIMAADCLVRGSLPGLGRILSNLINNAVEAKPSNVWVDLTIEGAGGQLRLQVRDDGQGIPPEILKKLGTQELSYGKATSQQSGSGVGVYYAAQEVKSWGGNLKIESTLGQGATMTIELPVNA